MTEKFKLGIGGQSGYDDSSDYTANVSRCSYNKVFCDDSRFDVILEGVDRSTDGSNIDFNKAVFFVVNDGTTDWCLFKGTIKKVRWTMQYTCRISGDISKRTGDGEAGDLGRLKAPEGASGMAITTEDFITDSTTFSGWKTYKDSGTGEGNETREW